MSPPLLCWPGTMATDEPKQDTSPTSAAPLKEPASEPSGPIGRLRHDHLDLDAEERRHVATLFQWVPVGSLHIDLAFLADPLSITMCLFVTGIGSLIHLYAVGYMHGDPRFSKFFLYLNLFALSMLLLVLGENLLVTFLGWEGVGTCSYFLISFWHTDPANASAGTAANCGSPW